MHKNSSNSPAVYYSLFIGDILSVMEVETDVSRGIFHFSIIGLVDKATSESSTRILSALKNCGFDIPQRKNHKVVVSLLPGNQKKRGLYTDLAILLGYLTCTNQINKPSQDQVCCIGEVRLDGSVHVNENIIQLILVAYKLGMRYFIVPKGSYTDMVSMPDIFCMEINSILDLKNIQFNKQDFIHSQGNKKRDMQIYNPVDPKEFDIDKLIGLESQKRALMIGLSGNHSLLFVGPPGSGKSALASSAEQLLDTLSHNEIISRLSSRYLLELKRFNIHELYTRPFLRIHNLITANNLIGGPRATGQIFKANHGAIILDELCEFDRHVIESLRHPLDTHILSTKIGNTTIKEQLLFTMIATTNPCPCGRKMTEKPCTCSLFQIKRYQSKISEPILDRIPIICQFAYTDHRTHSSMQTPKLSGLKIKRIIQNVRNQQRQRNPNAIYNNYLTVEQISRLGITPEGCRTLETIKESMMFSKRKLINIMRIARTIADIESKQSIEDGHLLEAASYVKTKPFN